MKKSVIYFAAVLLISVLFVGTISIFAATTPSAPTIAYTPKTPTNGNVTVTVNYPSGAKNKEYRIGSGVWTKYSSSFVVTSNNYVYARYQDNRGVTSAIGSVSITNIDKTPPANPTFSPSTTQLTNQSITVSISYSIDSATKQYKIGTDGIWTSYTGPVTINSNNTVYAKAADSVGNWTAAAGYTVTNIDKEAPVNPQINASTTQLTNSDVSVSIDYSVDSVIKQYKLGSTGIWQDYSMPLVVSLNDTIYAKAADSAGNWTSETSLVISNIDKVAPDAPSISASTTAETSGPVTIDISYSADSAVKQYQVGSGGVWTDYAGPVTLSSNATVYAKSSDAAGNWSQVSSYAVTNISTASSKIVFGYTVKYYSTDMSSYNSMVNNAVALDEIATATFNVDGYGNLTGTAPQEQLDFAKSNGITANLMISNNFDSAIAKQLLKSTDNRQKLIDNILNTLQAYNYQGVDIDIENIPAADRANFTAFMSDLYGTLKPLGYGVTVAVVAKTYDSPNASWTYGTDYAALANYADHLMIMAYDEHYPGGTPGAVASIGWVTKVVDYALTVVPSDKIVLGLAAYGYDWSGSTTKSYSINGCYNLAGQYGATINLDSATMSKYFTYSVNGVAHTVWFEDGETIAAKLDLVNSRDLKGIGIWRLGLENTAYWDTIKSKLNK